KDVGFLLRAPCVLELDSVAWDAAERAADLRESDDDTLVQNLRVLIRRLASLGHLRDEAAQRAMINPQERIMRLWRGLQPRIERFALAVTAGDIADDANLSISQVERAFHRWVTSFALVGPGLRNMTRHLRLKLAVVFLSAERVTVAEVAEAIGY